MTFTYYRLANTAFICDYSEFLNRIMEDFNTYKPSSKYELVFRKPNLITFK
jgi:hypothetical protein